MNRLIYLLALLAVFFILQLAFPGFTEILILDPSRPEQLWRIITSIFLHSGAEHLFFNGISLFFFAPALESLIGRNELYKTFLMGGIAGSIAYLALVFLGISPPIPALGASGAVYAVLGAVALFRPDSTVYLYFFPVKMRYAVVLWVAINLLYIADWSSGIGGAAHLGGLAFGILYAKRLKEKEMSEWAYY